MRNGGMVHRPFRAERRITGKENISVVEKNAVLKKKKEWLEIVIPVKNAR